MVDFVVNVVIKTGQANAQIAGVQQRLAGLQNTAMRMRSIMAGAFALIGIGATIRGLASLNDQYQETFNRIRTVSESQEQANKTFDRLGDIATSTRAPMLDLANIYQKGVMAANDIGASNEQLFGFVTVVGEALSVQGSKAQQAAGALKQLAQALGSANVRAEEFNSIVEGAFPIAQAAARGIDAAAGSVSKLYRLVATGQVTNKEFFAAILSQAESIHQAFEVTTATVDQSMQVINTQLLLFIHHSSLVKAGSEAIRFGLALIAKFLPQLIGLITALAIVMAVNFAAVGVPRFLAAMGLMNVAFLTSPVGLYTIAIAALIGIFIAFEAQIRSFLDSALGPVIDAFSFFGMEVTGLQIVLAATAAIIIVRLVPAFVSLGVTMITAVLPYFVRFITMMGVMSVGGLLTAVTVGIRLMMTALADPRILLITLAVAALAIALLKLVAGTKAVTEVFDVMKGKVVDAKNAVVGLSADGLDLAETLGLDAEQAEKLKNKLGGLGDQAIKTAHAFKVLHNVSFGDKYADDLHVYASSFDDADKSMKTASTTATSTRPAFDGLGMTLDGVADKATGMASSFSDASSSIASDATALASSVNGSLGSVLNMMVKIANFDWSPGGSGLSGFKGSGGGGTFRITRDATAAERYFAEQLQQSAKQLYEAGQITAAELSAMLARAQQTLDNKIPLTVTGSQFFSQAGGSGVSAGEVAEATKKLDKMAQAAEAAKTAVGGATKTPTNFQTYTPFQDMPGFNTGGSFTVPGDGIGDSVVAPIRVSPGEEVEIRQPDRKKKKKSEDQESAKAAAMRPIQITQIIQTPDVAGFRANRAQVEQGLWNAVRRAQRRQGA